MTNVVRPTEFRRPLNPIPLLIAAAAVVAFLGSAIVAGASECAEAGVRGIAWLWSQADNPANWRHWR